MAISGSSVFGHNMTWMPLASLNGSGDWTLNDSADIGLGWVSRADAGRGAGSGLAAGTAGFSSEPVGRLAASALGAAPASADAPGTTCTITRAFGVKTRPAHFFTDSAVAVRYRSRF